MTGVAVRRVSHRWSEVHAVEVEGETWGEVGLGTDLSGEAQIQRKAVAVRALVETAMRWRPGAGGRLVLSPAGSCYTDHAPAAGVLPG